MTVYQADDQNIQMAINRRGLVLIVFWAPWCSSCRKLTPVIEEISNGLASTAIIAKVHVEHNPTSVQTYGIKNIPTMLLFKDGALVKTFYGYKPKEKLLQLIYGVL